MKLYYWFDDFEEYEYEVDSVEALKAIGQPVEEEEENFREEIEMYYWDEAYEAYKDEREYRKNPLGYFGMKERDFI